MVGCSFGFYFILSFCEHIPYDHIWKLFEALLKVHVLLGQNISVEENCKLKYTTCVVGNIHLGPYWGDHMGTWVNRYETDSPLWVRRMDSANMVEMSMHWKI